jgi:Predicted nucleotide-binding protein containing TIR-like domain
VQQQRETSALGFDKVSPERIRVLEGTQPQYERSPRPALVRPPRASARCPEGPRDRFSSDATTETYDVKFLRQLRTPVTISDGGAQRRILARSAVVYQTLVSVSTHRRRYRELGFQPGSYDTSWAMAMARKDARLVQAEADKRDSRRDRRVYLPLSDCSGLRSGRRWMHKPRIFLGSSGKQAKLLQALTRGLEDVAHVEPWTTSFNPGTTTLERLLELAHEVDFAALVFARDDWTSASPSSETPPPESGQASPRDNVVFEAGLFGGALGMRRTFILHASGAKLPTDLLGLTSIRYGEAATATEIRAVNQKLRKAIESEGRVARIEGPWWQYSLTERTAREPSAVSLLQISRDRSGALEIAGRSWQENGTLSARYWSEAVKEKKDPAGVFYYSKGERPMDPNAPQFEGTGEIRLESADRASGYFTTRADSQPELIARTAGVYWRADPEDLGILDGRDDRRRAELIAERLKAWKSIAKA